MHRSTLAGLFFALVLVGGALWWLASGSHPPQQHSVSGLRDSTIIRWTSDDLPVIETSSSDDALTALGYAHGHTRGWTAVLWRQTALGRLGRWFGPGVFPLDRHARRLGMARHARDAYEQLPDDTQERLAAYAEGMNAALQSETVRNSDSFVLFDVEPSPWAPWHTLLVERLLAWTATPLLSPPDSAPASVHRFRTTDRLFRRWLHLHGWNRSVTWAVRSSSPERRPTLFQRHVLGASAVPNVQEVLWRRTQDSTVSWTTFPGTLLFPTGTTPQHAWGSLLHSPARLTRSPVDSTALHRWHERLDPAGGDERLLQIERIGPTLPLGRVSSNRDPGRDSLQQRSTGPDRLQAAPPDTAWVVEWPGFTAQSSLPAWLTRGGLTSRPPDSRSFSLFAADGLQVDANGTWRVLGNPSVVDSTGEAVLVGNTGWARHQAEALFDRAHTQDTTAVDVWSLDDSSAWAGALSSHLAPALRQFKAANEQFRTAATYLQNWDHRYTPNSIGALLFEEWMRAYEQDLGHVPTIADTSTFFAHYRQRRALLRALDTLTSRIGPVPHQWRWDRVVTAQRYFPVWSADSLVSDELEDLRTTRYAPVRGREHAHPSALGGGPSLVDSLPVTPAPTTWEGWTQPGGPLTVRGYRYDSEAHLTPSRTETAPPSPTPLVPEETDARTVLLPAD